HKKEGESEYDPVDEKSINNFGLAAEGRYLLDKINELSPTFKEPVYLRFVEGLSPPEIGIILGISANAASVRVNRGILELRKITGYNK
ncbi:MAG: RNA polymerase sigma factor, partial [Minisyncoccia bacterium]